VSDENLVMALTEMLDDRESLTRALLGSAGPDGPQPDGGPGVGVPMPQPHWGPRGPGPTFVIRGGPGPV